MKFSLVTATLGRTQEMLRLLDSLDTQTHRGFELIVVDQNPDDRIASILERYETKFPITRVYSNPGVSRARNVGLRHVTGTIIGFPDDDCWYSEWLLERIAGIFRTKHIVDGVTGQVADENGDFDARFDRSGGYLTLSNAWQRTAGVSVFLRKNVVDEVGGFDETLGPNSGTVWGGGEDIDYAIRVVRMGFKIYYEPELRVFHERTSKYGYKRMARRAYAYGAGIGRVWRKHDYPLWLVAYYFLRPAGGALLSLVTGRLQKARYHWMSLRGRARGWAQRGVG